MNTNYFNDRGLTSQTFVTLLIFGLRDGHNASLICLLLFATTIIRWDANITWAL
jgi:hypothetical protein